MVLYLRVFADCGDSTIYFSLSDCRWWRPQFCPNHRQSATTESLNLETVAGMYLVLLAGVVLSVTLCLVQFFLAKYRARHRQVSSHFTMVL